MSAYSNKSNNQRLEDLHWLLADDKSASWFYERVAREILNFKTPLAGGGETTLATKAAWQASEFAQIKNLQKITNAQLTILTSAIEALAASSNADADEVKALISKKMDEATSTIKAELDELQAEADVEVPKMSAVSYNTPATRENPNSVPVASVNPDEVPELDDESKDAAPVSNV